jgi:hypothetical protein
MSSRPITTTRQSIAALVAVLALVAQVVVPHVHVRHAQDVAPHAPAVALASCDACPLGIGTDHAGHDADTHRDATCPLCRAQSDARASLLPPSVALPLPVAAVARGPRDAVASVADAVRGLAAPRAPPALS